MAAVYTSIFLLSMLIGLSETMKWSSSDASDTAKTLLEFGAVYHKYECLLTNNCKNQENKYTLSASNKLQRYETALMMLGGFGGISLILAVVYNAIRKHIFQESTSVDRAFDAGGKVSTSLTSVTVASQLLWPADILQGATVTARVGIAGPFWYAVGAAINIAIFPIMSAQLKTRAPGAKTYPQIIYARYGRAAHLVYCTFALMVNVVILVNLLVAGAMAIQRVTLDTTPEFCVLIMATLFGSYSFIGGLGTTFYVSYFNTMVLYISLIVLILKIFYFPDGISSEEKFQDVYNRVKSLTGPEGNEERSMLTFLTIDGAIFGIVGFCLTSSITYCDQASWQSRIAAKPLQGVIGFFIATFMWFGIPSTISATTGMVYLSRSTENGTKLLNDEEIVSGMVTPWVAQDVLGSAGSILVLTMIGMALMSTGSGEVMAVSSIIVYDLYQTHIEPFRKSHNVEKCILCDKRKVSDEGGSEKNTESGNQIEEQETVQSNDYCTCPNVVNCEYCTDETPQTQKKPVDYSVKRMYLCPHHGAFRVYQDKLYDYKNWCILWVTLGMVPFGLLVDISGINLNWTLFVGCVLTVPGLPGVILTILWSKTTGPAVIAGGVIGLIFGVTSLLVTATQFEGGMSTKEYFFKNTAEPFALLAGSGTSMISSFLISIVVSLATHKIKTSEDEAVEWKKLRDIDNPLSPWSELFREDFPNLAPKAQPTKEQFDKLFRKARIVAVAGALFIIILFIIIVPSVMASLHVLTFEEFLAWTKTLHAWCFIMAVVVIIFPPVEEIMQISKQIALNKIKREEHKKANTIEDLREMKRKQDIVMELKGKQETTESKDCTV